LHSIWCQGFYVSGVAGRQGVQGGAIINAAATIHHLNQLPRDDWSARASVCSRRTVLSLQTSIAFLPRDRGGKNRWRGAFVRTLSAQLVRTEPCADRLWQHKKPDATRIRRCREALKDERLIRWPRRDLKHPKKTREIRSVLKQAAQNPAQLAHNAAHLPPIWRLLSKLGPPCRRRPVSRYSGSSGMHALMPSLVHARWAVLLACLATRVTVASLVILAFRRECCSLAGWSGRLSFSLRKVFHSDSFQQGRSYVVPFSSSQKSPREAATPRPAKSSEGGDYFTQGRVHHGRQRIRCESQAGC
jgi:hypothetical protein